MDASRCDYRWRSLFMAQRWTSTAWATQEKEWVRNRVCWSAQSLVMCRCGRCIVYTPCLSLKNLHLWWPTLHCLNKDWMRFWFHADQLFHLSSLRPGCQGSFSHGISPSPAWVGSFLWSNVSCDRTREPCCCCDCCCCCQLGFGKFGGAKGSAAVILCLSWIAARNSGLFPPCWLGKCRHWNPIHLRLSLLLRTIQYWVEILCIDHLRYICRA